MIDPNLTPTEATIPTLESPIEHVLAYAQVALICGSNEHQFQVAKFIIEWNEKSNRS
jgi:hypothetical protein